MEHTKEPWKFSPWHIEEDAAAVRAPEGWIICQTSSDANARRIVAAVNACASIPTPALEAGVVGEMQSALEQIVAWKEPIGILAPGLGGLLKSIYRAEAILSTLTDHEESNGNV